MRTRYVLLPRRMGNWSCPDGWCRQCSGLCAGVSHLC